MDMYYKCLCVLVLSSSSWSVCGQGGSDVISNNYHISSNNKQVGYYSESRQRVGDEVKLVRKISIDTSAYLWKVKYNSVGTLTFAQEVGVDYRLKNIDRRITHDNNTYRIEGNKHMGDFYLNFGAVANLVESKDSDLTEGVFALAASTVPYLGMALSIFSNEEKDKNLMLSRTDYDATFADIPYFIGELSAQATVYRLLDTQGLVVKNYKISRDKDEHCSVKNETIACQKIKLIVDDFYHTYWFASDPFGPYLIKAKGVDGDGPYSIDIVYSGTDSSLKK